MQVGFRALLAVSLTTVSASCMVDSHGLAGKTGGVMGAAGVTGAAGETMTIPGGDAATGGAGSGAVGGAGNPGAAGDTSGTGGEPSAGGMTGTAGTTDTAGTTGSAGVTGTAGVTGAAGATGFGGTTGAAGTTGLAGTTGTAGITGTAGTTGISLQGCSDGTREGYLDTTKYPTVAACSGAWDEPGLTSPASRTPKCNRQAGNDGARPTGGGCSAADLCAIGWHVCETAESLAGVPNGCADAIAPFADNRVFFVTRQRANGLNCSATATGSNNVYGCGNFGGTSDHSCNPLTRLLRDSDCDNNAPWSCSNGNLGQDQNELDQVVKGGPLHGGVLCCKD